MIIEVGGINLVELIEIASIVGGVLAMLVGGFLFYLLVRPPRHVRQARNRPLDSDPSGEETLLSSMDRMEERLAHLERALVDRTGKAPARDQQRLELAEANTFDGRMK